MLDLTTTPELAKDGGLPPRFCSASSDWQVIAIYSKDFWEEVDCMGGARRKIHRGTCKCGEVVHVEINCPRTCRTDGKRIFYPEEPNTDWCVFRCRGCGEPIGDTCEAAAYGQNANSAGDPLTKTSTEANQ